MSSVSTLRCAHIPEQCSGLALIRNSCGCEEPDNRLQLLWVFVRCVAVAPRSGGGATQSQLACLGLKFESRRGGRLVFGISREEAFELLMADPQGGEFKTE